MVHLNGSGSSVLLSDERRRRSKVEWNWRGTLLDGWGNVILHPSALRSVAAEAGPVSRGVGQHHDERRFNPATRRITNLKEISRRTVRTGAPVAIEGRKRETLGGKVYTQESRKCPKHSHDVHSPPAKAMNSVTVDIFTDVQFPIHVAVTCKIQWLLFFSYAQRCISYDRFGLSVCLSVTVRYHVTMTQATIMRSSLKIAPWL